MTFSPKARGHHILRRLVGLHERNDIGFAGERSVRGDVIEISCGERTVIRIEPSDETTVS